MPFTIEQDGEEIQVFTAEEVAAKDAEMEKLRRVNAEKTENFRRYNEMSKEEKEMYDENTLNLIKRGDVLEDTVKTLKETLAQKEAREQMEKKDATLRAFHNGNPEIKTKLEEKYAILAGMPETTPEEIQARTIEAAKLAGITLDSRNPIYQPINGEAPSFKEANNYTDTTAGKEAEALMRQAMGLPEVK